MNFAMFLELHARGMPDKVAVIDGERQMTFAELDRASSRFARHLCEQGVRRGERVAIHVPNCLEAPISYFGSLKAGAVAVLLNWRHRGPELARTLAHCSPAILVTAAPPADLSDGLPHVGAVLSTVGEPGLPAFFEAMSGPAAFAAVQAQGGDLANLLYTSGTTGVPKATMQTHGMRLAHAAGVIDSFKLSSRDVGLAVSPLFHTSGFSVLFSAMFVGATAVLMDRWDIAAFVETVRRREVTYMHLIGTVVVDIVRAPEALFHPRPTSVRLSYGGGHAIGPEIMAAYEARMGGVFSQGYGRTEGGFAYNPPVHDEQGVGSHGRPNRNGSELAIMDAGTERLLPDGETGTVVVRGDGVSDGYWDVDYPRMHRLLEGGWQSTGDLGLIDRNGFLHFLGRTDQLIKTGGENVYPSEVSEVLLAMPEVADAVVMGVPDDRLGQRVAALVVPADPDLSAETTVARCRERLAGYKIPRLVRFASALPRQANQKVDLAACRAILTADAAA